MAPERLLEDRFVYVRIAGLPKESDIYSIAMTSFQVRSSVVDHPTTFLMQLPHYDQVLTETLPYDGGGKTDVITDIRHGKRPTRPTDPNQNQWLHDRVWATIVTCWSDKPKKRHELSVVYHVFLGHGQQGTQNDKLGNLNTHNNRNLPIAKRF